ncbi:single-stranded-DNA-specific exonuclease recJ [Vibrio ishigakensis]|uniref:Single-stranded-DNA-specific exonuclease recJ n=1 Tax=Vibrio ishigakensis TaxID=1481914 RepID=A0A0B8NHQ0_9VIBR|nr:single-stranded-DNA-specific exonuclease recJ [Vibrio ishigakensis]
MIEIQRRPACDISHLPDSLSPLMRRVYASRGVNSESQLNRGAKGLLSPGQLYGIGPAADLLIEAIESSQRIIVVGDFDADGATSSALSVLALRMLGSSNVDYLVPNRFEDGYGLSQRWLTKPSPWGLS